MEEAAHFQYLYIPCHQIPQNTLFHIHGHYINMLHQYHKSHLNNHLSFFLWNSIHIYCFGFTTPEILYMVIGGVVAFFVSIYSVKFMMGWIKKNNFKIFGYYRIVLGTIILIWYIISNLLK